MSLGNRQFTVNAVGGYTVGTRARVFVTGSPTIFMEGVIFAINTLDIVVTVDTLSGTGTYNTWRFAVAGERGPTGPTGPASTVTGPTGSLGPTGPTGPPRTYRSGI
jgi:hypothetical protein